MTLRSEIARRTPDRWKRLVIRAELDFLARRRVRRGQLGPLPDFLMLGVMKGGTSSFWEHLKSSPVMNPGPPKEILYFDQYSNRSVDWYRSFFYEADPPPGRLHGDGTLTNFPSLHAPARAKALVPDARLLVLLRNPVARAVSHYHHNKRRNEESRGMLDAFEHEAALLRNGAAVLFEDPTGARPDSSYLRRGHYATQLENWLRHYPREQLCIIFSEAYFADPLGEMRRFLDFVGRPEVSVPPAKRFGESGAYQGLPEGVQELLDDHFRDENARLGELLEQPVPWLGNP
ncbi:MAG: sulfotransferase domain-containing protein [Proteobacteria bacterium]|nr:sulfotransferase domain-containing protein [Pseudomonadota bacterium]